MVGGLLVCAGVGWGRCVEVEGVPGDAEGVGWVGGFVGCDCAG